MSIVTLAVGRTVTSQYIASQTERRTDRQTRLLSPSG